MRVVKKRCALLMLGVVAVAATAGAACGGSSNNGSASPTAKPATTSTAAPAKPTVAATQASGESSGASTLAVVGKNNTFDKTELKAKAGTVTINFDNQDEGIPHNFHVYKGKDNTGQDVGKTEIVAGPNKQTLTLDLTPGEYFYVCEVHPATMSGKLTVQ